VKLADFGLSAMGLINKQARDGVEESNVVAPDAGVRGTPHYLAPEVLLGLPHTQAVDWWALGVLLFEFVNGYPPFDGDTVQEVFSEIFAGSINWPAADDEMSDACKDLIKRLLENDPHKRLHDAIKVS
jgi:serine/threonine protein kinase